MLDLDSVEEVAIFLSDYKEKQKEYADTENFCYPKLSLCSAAKYKLFFSSLLLHPLTLKVVAFFEPRDCLNDDEIKEFIREVIEYELTESFSYLSTEELNKLIKIHKEFKIIVDEENAEV